MSPPLRAVLPGAAVGLAALSWYVATLAPSLVWADGGRLQTDAITGASLYWHFEELAAVHTDGLPFDRLGVAAWDHPLWVMIGHGLVSIAPGDPAWLLNLLSAVAAALAVVMVHVIVRTVTSHCWAAAAGAVALGVSHVFWFHAVTAEVYALHALFMTSLIAVAVRGPVLTRRRLALVGLISGLGLANHVMFVLTAIPVAVYLAIRHRRSPPARRPSLGLSTAASTAAIFLLGLAPWWIQFMRMSRVAGLDATLTMAAGFPWLGQRWPGPVGPELATNAAEYLAMALYQFTPIGLGIAVFGAIRLRGRPEAALLWTLFAVHATFSAYYQVADRFAFHLPSYVIVAVFIGTGVAAGLEALAAAPWPRKAAGPLAVATMALPVAIYAAVPSVLREQGFGDSDVGIPEVGANARDGIGYFLNPNQRGDDSAVRYGHATLSDLAPRAHVLVEWPDGLESYIAMRHYQLTRDLRPDVDLDLMLFTGLPARASMMGIVESESGCRPLYVASRAQVDTIAQVEPDLVLVQEGQVFRILPRTGRRPVCGDALDRPEASIDDLLRSVRR